MKITLFATIAGTGGMQMNGRGLARIFLRAGHEVQILSSVLDAASAGEVKAGENDDLLQSGAKIAYIPERTGSLQRWRELLRLTREVRSFRPGVLIGMGTSWHLGLLGLTVPRKVRKIFYEGMSGETNGARDPRWLVSMFFDEVIGQSPLVTKNFKRSFRWTKKTAAIPAFPEPLELTAMLPKMKRHLVPHGTARAAVFSRLAEGKQALWLVRQWSALKELLGVLHIHGRGPEQRAIENYITEHRLQERVRCFGAYPSGQAYVNLLTSYHLTLLPTIFPEGAPLVLLESMACGVPFVANGVGGIPDYATDNPDCLVVPKQAEFLDGIGQMSTALAKGEIDQGRLQHVYLARYSQPIIEKQWLGYLMG